MIIENINKLYNELPSHVKLIAVSKTKPIEDIEAAYNIGQKRFGENKVQEMVDKYTKLPNDIEWHMIGHLQSNKVKYIAPFVSYIHSVDSPKILEIINKEAKKNNRVINCLLQIYIAKEETKFGFDENEIMAFLESDLYKSFDNIKICGMMGMATYTENMGQIRNEFKNLFIIFTNIKSKYFTNKEYFKELSMGMSGDYRIAIEEGSTMIRLGSSIFGERNYKSI
jgi:pyridoxal phosphate enzyme (YggS family)